MANKQKLQNNVSKKPQGEKTQRNVHIVKHFQPNVVYNKLHRNCDLPEVNVEVDPKESLNKIKKSIVSHALLGLNKKSSLTSNLTPNISSKNERKSGKSVDSHSTPFLRKLNNASKLKSVTRDSLTSGSSTPKEHLPLKLNKTGWATGVKPTDKQINLKKTLLKPSSTNSSISSKENYSTKPFRTNKSKSFSVSNTKKEKIDLKSEFSSVGDKSERVEDLKKEIKANQLQKLGSHGRDNYYNSSARRERVQSLRNEIKNLINTNIDDKRKHLTELTTEIAEFRTNKNVLVYYNVDIQANENKPGQNIQERSPQNVDERVDVPHGSKGESSIKSSQKFCGLPVEAPEIQDHQIPVGHKLGPRNIQNIRSIIQVETKPKRCHKCVVTEDSVQSKIRETNKLIEHLQKTLNEIRYRTKVSHIAEDNEIVGIKTEEAVEIFDVTENKEDKIEIEQDSDGENNAASISDATEATSSESENLPPQVPNTTPEELRVESEQITIEERKLSDEHIDTDDVIVDSLRPKSRRPCGCRKKAVEASDKFRTAAEGRTNETDAFEILQAKLDAIVESADSDDSNKSKDKPTGGNLEGPRVSFVGSADWLFQDFVSTGPSVGTQHASTAVQSVSTAAGSSQTEKTHEQILVHKNTDSFEISPTKPQPGLSVQMLPPLSIRREPVSRKLVNFFIDSYGSTHVTFINKGCNVGFFEMRSSSWTKVYSAECSEIMSTDKKTEAAEWALFNELNLDSADVSLINRSQENKPARMRKERSLSDTELYSSKGETPKSISEVKKHWERNKVLQSYQLLDENTRHDPGILSALSLDVISGIDEDVYKTYINPKGFGLPPMSTSTVSALKPKKAATLEKLPSVKLLNKLSGSVSDYTPKKIKKAEGDKLSQVESKTNNDKAEPSGAPKLYNIGLYKSISTQIVPIEQTEEIKERKAKAAGEKNKEIEMEEKKEKTKKTEEKESEEIKKVMKEKLLLDELALRYQAEREKTAQEDERKETDKGRDRENIGEEKKKKGKNKESEEVGGEMVKQKVPLDEIAKRIERKEMDKSGERVSQVASSRRDEPKVARSSMSYERISLSISYSTEESTFTESSSDTFQSTSDEPQHHGGHSKSGSYPRGSTGSQTFKDLKEKIMKEHAFEQCSDMDMSSEEEGDSTSNVAVPSFISGLLNASTASIKKAIPNIRRSVKEAKSDMRHSLLVAGKSTTKLDEEADEETNGSPTRKSRASTEKKRRKSPQPDDSSKRLSTLTSRRSFDDDSEEKELRNHNYHVAPVHVHGDSIPTHRRMARPPDYQPVGLRVGKNGRYKDEEDMFCESNSPQFENSLHRRFRIVSEGLYKTKFAMDSSNSDTVTNAERVPSEGEVRCECSVSIGEIHACRRRQSPPRLRRQLSFSTGEPSPGIMRRRTYFNNWVTYYVNKNAVSVNDSSSTS